MSEGVAEEIELQTGRKIEVARYPAKWEEYGPSAGPIRNRTMLDEEDPDLVVAFHDRIENSKGTKDMIFEANKRGVSVHLYSGRDG